MDDPMRRRLGIEPLALDDDAVARIDALDGDPAVAALGELPAARSIGGCRERVDLNGPTVSPQTRRKPRGVPQCSVAALRRVVAGFAGPHAATATLTAPGYRKTLKLQPKENGTYLLVLRSISGG